MSVLCAVSGIGQTKHDVCRADVSIAGLVREAAKRALEDAGMTWKDIDAVVLGKAPDMFEGMMMPELGRSLVHKEGLALVSDWINSLEGQCL